MRILKWEDSVSDPDLFDQVSALMNEGGLMAYPTDTLYGLGVDARSSAAVQRINSLKGRRSPISVMLSSVEWLLDVAIGLGHESINIIKTHLPGALTVICKTEMTLAGEIFSEQGSVGFRVPDHEFCLKAVEVFGHPITTTSTNPTGEAPARSVEQIQQYFDTRLDLIIDGGAIQDSPGSTVIDLSGPAPHILREGSISTEVLLGSLN